MTSKCAAAQRGASCAELRPLAPARPDVFDQSGGGELRRRAGTRRLPGARFGRARRDEIDLVAARLQRLNDEARHPAFRKWVEVRSTISWFEKRDTHDLTSGISRD